MEKRIELKNGQPGISGGLMERFLVIKEKGTIESPLIEMDKTERMFIIMSRIAVALRKTGLHCSVSIHDSDYCEIIALLHKSSGDCKIVESVNSLNVTETELLEWWSAIENGVE